MGPKDSVEPSTVLDHEILGDKANISHEEAMHFGVLTPDELATEKKLRRKIDSLIVSTESTSLSLTQDLGAWRVFLVTCLSRWQ
jgi:hypothetical protein